MDAFAHIVGHRDQLFQLSQDLAQGNVAHAYLLAGPVGVGKFTVAKAFAEALLTSGTDDAERDAAAGQIRRLLHPDLHVLDWLWVEGLHEDAEELARHSNVPQDHRRKAKAKTDAISIDDVRALQDRLHDVGTGRYKCCLIRSVERMQESAVNALLKILEEPPPGTVFLLTTQALGSLLPTIVSRTRVLRFSRLRDGDLEPLLTAVPEEDRRFILRVAQGAPGIAKSLASDPDALRAEREYFTSAMAFWHARQLQERLRILVPLHENGPEADRLLLHLSLALRDELRDLPPGSADALMALVRGLEGNASRQLLAQRFALDAAAS